jgi:DNA-binding SARP family transcriptional activator/tRNA A-37 threonylcarbamoyl transferase component Bud32
VRFQILGPVEVVGDDGPITLGGRKQRAVLAHLLIRANRVVPAEVLIAELWGEEPPDAARGTLQAYVSRLRSSLGDHRIEGRSPGYVLRVHPGESDAERFESLVRDARADAAEDPAQAAGTFDEALALWRGPALADLSDEASLGGEIARLEELRLSSIEEKIASELALGLHGRLVGELEALSKLHPLRERLWGDLMLALYRSGRQAEALEAFRRARQILAEELGIDPSRRLRRLHELILAQDPSLSSPSRPMPVRRATSPGAGELPAETEIAGYRIEDLLGRGGMSTVYLAEDVRLRRRIALKVLSPELARQPGFRERFVRESQIAAGMEHPGIVPIYGAGEADGHLYIAMRYVRGTDLRRLLAEHGPLEPDRAVRLVRNVADALDAAHAEGLVHRDVKPANILLVEGVEGKDRDDEVVYLSDFGLTKRLEGSTGALTRTGQFVGTVDYVAPEQVEGRAIDGRADVYSLTCVLFECLTGKPPFRKDSDVATLYAHVRDEAPKATDVSPELPAPLNGVLARGLAKDPAKRYASCRNLADAARAAIAPSVQPGSGGRPIGKRPAVVAAAIAVAVIAAAVLLVALTRGVDAPGRDNASPPAAVPRFPMANRAPTSDEARLLALIPRGLRPRCGPVDLPTAAAFQADGAVGGVACAQAGVEVLFELFGNKDAMDAAFGKRAYAADAYGGDCGTDPKAQNAYTIGGAPAGRVLCQRSVNQSEIAWTDERILVLGDAWRNDIGDVSLYQWWRTAGPVVEGTVAEKDAFSGVPQAPQGTFMINLTERDNRRLHRLAKNVPFDWRGTFGIRFSHGTYTLVRGSLGRFGQIDSGTYLLSKGPVVVLTSSSCFGKDVSASYRWRMIGSEIEWTLERVLGANARSCAPGPWPITIHPWLRVPSDDIAYSVQGQIVVAHLGTLDFSRVTHDQDVENIQPVWSPDGTKIAFAAKSNDGYDLYVMDADGANVRRLTNDPGDELDPAWSPDGTEIAYQQGPACCASGPTSLSVLSLADGTAKVLVARPSDVGRPAWSPDGSRIAFRTLSHTYEGAPRVTIYVVRPDGSGLTALAHERTVPDTAPAWTPDGRRIVFWGDRSRRGRAPYSIRPDGSGLRRFRVPLHDFFTIDWSFDGRWMVLGSPWHAAGTLHLVSANGSQVFTIESTAGEPRFRPTGG